MAIAYELVNLTCDSTSPPDCVQTISITTYLPPGLFQLIMHVRSTTSDIADVYYSPVPALVAQPQLLDPATPNPIVCGLLTNSLQDDPLTQASLLATLTTSLVDGYGLGGLTVNSSELGCDAYNNTDGTTGFGSIDGSGDNGDFSVADRLLAAMLTIVEAMTDSGSPLAINVANSLSTAAYSIVSALSSNGTAHSQAASPLLSSSQVWSLLNLTESITDYLSMAGVGFQSGNNSASDTFNTAFDNLAGIYGQLLTANTSDPSMHCTLVHLLQSRFSSLLTTAMDGHVVADPDVSFTGAAFSASTSRIVSGANSTVSQLAMSIPADAFVHANSSYFDVQRIIFQLAQTQWLGCYPTTVWNQAAASSNLTGSALLPTSLYVVELITPSGTQYAVQGISVPIQFTLPYANENLTAAEFTPNCAFYNRTSSTWSTDGCTSVVNNASVSCACNHLTEFTLISRPLSAALGNGQAQLSATEAAKHADLLGIFIMYLIPLGLSLYLLVMAGIVYRTQASVVPWANPTYLVIAVVSTMRAVCLALMYFDNMNSATTAFDQNSLSATTTALLLLPLIVEVVLLAVLGYRYAVARRKEGASQMVNGKIDLRRASMYTGPASLMPQLDESVRDRRPSILQRLSIVGVSEKPVTEPPGYRAPAILTVLFIAATIGALVAYLVLEKRTQSTSTFSAVSALFALTFVAALTIIATWVVFLHYSVPNLKAVMRRGQTLGWIAVFAFFLQSILVLAFAEQRSGSWYFVGAGGVHVMMAIYAIVEVFTLCGMALWWRWTLQWWRGHQVSDLVSKYDFNDSHGLYGTKDKDAWLGPLSTPMQTARVADTNSAQRDRLDSMKLGAHRPSIAESMIFSAAEADEDGVDPLAGTTALDKTQPVVTSIESSLEAGKAKDVRDKYSVEAKTNDTEQAFSSEARAHTVPALDIASPSASAVSPANISLQAVTASLLTARPMTVWSNANSINSSPSQYAVVDGPMTTPLHLPDRHRPSVSISASPLVMAADSPLGSSATSSVPPSAAATPHMASTASRIPVKRQSCMTNLELSSATAAPITVSEKMPASPRIHPSTPASLPSPVAMSTVLSMMSAASTAPASSATAHAPNSPRLPTVDDIAASADSTVQPSTASILSALPRSRSPSIAANPLALTPLPIRPLLPPIERAPASALASTVASKPAEIELSQVDDTHRAAGGQKSLRMTVSRAEEDEPLSPFAIPSDDDNDDHKQQDEQGHSAEVDRWKQSEPAPHSPLNRNPLVERVDEPTEPVSPMLLPTAASTAHAAEHGHIIHHGKQGKVTRDPIVLPDSTFILSTPLASVASSGTSSPVLSPSPKPNNHSRARVSRSSVSAIPTEEPKFSPSLLAASAIYQPHRRPSVSKSPDAQRGSVIRGGSPARQAASHLQPRGVNLAPKQRMSASVDLTSPASESEVYTEGVDESHSPQRLHPQSRLTRPQSLSIDPSAADSAQLQSASQQPGARVTRAASFVAVQQQPRNNNFFDRLLSSI